ncbi:MAG: ABC transporter permease [Prevotellaceae bacterium]|jgi:putative ABC transport system permease protein|nr:ABC transporter permease [Prevotellaceae bacterium]
MRIDLDSSEEILVTITRNKTRSLLTAFGVFWGIFMLVALIGAGNGMQDSLRREFAGFATNSAFVFPEYTSMPYKGFRKGRNWSLDVKDVDRLRRNVNEIDVITPSFSYWGRTMTRNENTFDGVIKGVYPLQAAIEEPDITYGRYLNDVDISEARKVCVIGRQVYESLFHAGEDPCGERIQLDGTYYTVVGLNVSEGNISINGSASESIDVPYTTMQQAYNLGNDVDVICLTVKPGVKVSAIEEKIKTELKAAHLIHPDDKQAVGMLNAEALFSMIDNVMLGVRILMWMVGLGTLLAGAIGVSNIMMVTVKERTTEIGIRRAIGARPRDIMQQILSESLVLTSIAGMAGISFGVFVLQVLETAANDPGHIVDHYQVSFGMAVGTAALLVALGMLAGLAPAYRAMAIKPIEAIRDE